MARSARTRHCRSRSRTGRPSRSASRRDVQFPPFAGEIWLASSPGAHTGSTMRAWTADLAVVAAVLAITAVAVLVVALRARRREATTRRRTALLASAGELLDRGVDLEELARMAVPELADLCVIDLHRDGDRLRLAAVCAVDSRLSDGLRLLRTELPVATRREQSRAG